VDNYTITVNLIPGLPQIPYEKGVGAYDGVVLHSTAVYDDTTQAEREYETRNWNTAFVHAFVDDTTILQTADFNHIAWHAAQTANSKFIGLELCQSHDAQKFAAAYDRWVWLAAKLLYDKKLGVVDGVTLLSHKQVSDKWHQCDHEDPLSYLQSHNKTWADVVADVTAKYNEMEAKPVGRPTWNDITDRDKGWNGFTADVEWAFNNEILGNYPDKTIRRYDPISREQFAYAIHMVVKKLAAGQLKG
jgi:N-acetylmuramoyl-L-alanine amidase CwlA